MSKKDLAGADRPASGARAAGNASGGPMLISVKEVIAIVGCSRSLWHSMVASGRTPAPVRLGRRTLWRREEIIAWVEAGCPTREKWEKLRSVV